MPRHIDGEAEALGSFAFFFQDEAEPVIMISRSRTRAHKHVDKEQSL